MALSTDPQKVYAEIQAAVKFTQRHVKQSRKLVEAYVGRHYRDDLKPREMPENFIATFIAGVLPQLVFDNPKVLVKAHRPVTGKEVAKWMEEGMNQWIKVSDLVGDLEQVALDVLFSFGVLKAGMEEVGGQSFMVSNAEPGENNAEQVQDNNHGAGRAHMPFLCHVPTDMYFLDSQCRSYANRRIEGMKFIRDIEDVKNDESYDPVERAKLAANYDARKDEGRTFKAETNDAHRDQVVLYEVFFNETGEIGVIAGDGAPAWLKKPQKFAGPQSPYVLVGAYIVPDSPFPLSPLCAVADQFLELNGHAAAGLKEEANRKSIVVVNGDKPAVGASIRQAANGSVIEIKGFTPQDAQTFSIGGTSPDRMKMIEALRSRLDRLLGQSDAMRGMPSGVTATESMIAKSSGDVRIEFLQRHFRQGIKTALGKIAWYMFNDPGVVFRVGVTNPQTGEENEGTFLGGTQHPGQQDLNWTQYNLEIEPYSMVRMDPSVQAAQANTVLQLAIQIAPLIPQLPFVNWENLVDDIGEAHNISGLWDRIFRSGMLGMAPNAMAMGQLPPNADPGMMQGIIGQQLHRMPSILAGAALPGVVGGASPASPAMRPAQMGGTGGPPQRRPGGAPGQMQARQPAFSGQRMPQSRPMAIAGR